MQQTVFKISKMDCPSEEQMIRMKLADLTTISALDFDIPNRQLTVLHTGSPDIILQRLHSLNFGTSLLDSCTLTTTQTSPNHHANNTQKEQVVLWQVLAINFFFFGLELITGFMANSMGLVADSLDMLADSIVYGLALFAVGGTIAQKKKIAKLAGYLQLLLALLGFAEVIRRFLDIENMPTFQSMILISVLALIGNALCLYLLQKMKSQEAHIQATMIFTSNDVIVNIGVIVAGGLVYLTQSKYPDLIIGTIVFFIVGQGALRILKLSK